MGTNMFKTQFSAGELSPALYAGVNQQYYQAGARKIRNFFVRPQGGIINRPGTVCVGNCRKVLGNETVRLIPFQYSEQDSYVLELTHKMMRVIRNGGYVLATESIDGVQTLIERRLADVTNGEGATFTTTTDHGFPNGVHVTFTGVADMTELNGRVAVVKSHTADTFTLENFDGTPFDTSGFGDYVAGDSGGRVRRIFQKSLPYEDTELALLKYDQSADVMTLVHTNHPQRYLTRQDHAVWRLDDAVFEPTISPPTSVIATPSHLVKENIEGVTRASVGEINLPNSQTAFAKGSAGFVRNVGGMADLRDKVVILGEQTSEANQIYEMQNTRFEDYDTAAFSAYTSGGTFEGDTLYRYIVTAVDEDGQESRTSEVALVASKAMSSLTEAGKPFPKIGLKWEAAAGAASYNIYRQREVPSGAPSIGDTYGYIGRTTATAFVDQNIAPDFTKTPPQEFNPFLETVTFADLYHILKTDPAEFQTIQDHGFEVGDYVKVRSVVGMTEVNGVLMEVDTVPAPWKFTAKRVSDGTAVDASGYKAFALNIDGITNANPAVITTNGTHNFKLGQPVTIDSVEGMNEINGIDAFVKTYTETTLTLVNATTGRVVDSSSWGTRTGGGVIRSGTGTVERRNPQNKPFSTCYFQQRKVYGGSSENPQTVWLSQTGNYNSMDKSTPIRDSDAIELGIASLEVNSIKHLVPLSSLLVFTDGAVFKLSGGNGAALTPSSVQAVPQDYFGSNDVRPLLFGTDVVYCSKNGDAVNAISYSFAADAYQSQDISIRSRHLIERYKIKEWASAKSPHDMIVAVREDGDLVFITYLKDAGIVAWARGDTGEDYPDCFESVCSVRENGEDVVYLVARRYQTNESGSSFQKYVERLHSRNIYKGGKEKDENKVFLDSAVIYNGEGNSTGASVKTVTNLHHLEGRTVTIVADGNVLEPAVVENGAVTLARAATVIVVGIPYTSELETLPIDNGSGQISGLRKKINRVRVRLADSRGVEVMAEGSNDGYTMAMEAPLYGTTRLPLFTGDMEYTMYGNVSNDGVIFVRQANPLPCEILGLIPDITVTEENGRGD